MKLEIWGKSPRSGFGSKPKGLRKTLETAANKITVPNRQMRKRCLQTVRYQEHNIVVNVNVRNKNRNLDGSRSLGAMRWSLPPRQFQRGRRSVGGRH